jgi:RNA polymerase sigma factor (sigma-70 family)
VYRKRMTYDARGSFAGWLFTVARSVGMNAVSARRGHLVQQQADSAVAADADGLQLRTALHDAVMTLPQRQRDVVLLRLVEGMSTAETAQRLGCAQGTVKASLHHALRKLQLLLKENVQ